MEEKFYNCPNCENEVPIEWKSTAWLCPFCNHIIPGEDMETVPQWFIQSHPYSSIFNKTYNNINKRYSIEVKRSNDFHIGNNDNSCEKTTFDAEKLMKDGKYKEALENLNKRISVDSFNVNLRYRRVICMYSIGCDSEDNKKTVKEDLEILKSNPTTTRLHDGLLHYIKYHEKNKLLLRSLEKTKILLENVKDRQDFINQFNEYRVDIIIEMKELLCISETCLEKNIINIETHNSNKENINSLLCKIDEIAVNAKLNTIKIHLFEMLHDDSPEKREYEKFFNNLKIM